MLLKRSFVTNTYQHVVRFAGLGLLALTPLPAAAQGWYAGAGLGQAQADLKSFRQEIEDYGSTTYGRDCASAGSCTLPTVGTSSPSPSI